MRRACGLPEALLATRDVGIDHPGTVTRYVLGPLQRIGSGAVSERRRSAPSSGCSDIRRAARPIQPAGISYQASSWPGSSSYHAYVPTARSLSLRRAESLLRERNAERKRHDPGGMCWSLAQRRKAWRRSSSMGPSVATASTIQKAGWSDVHDQRIGQQRADVEGDAYGRQHGRIGEVHFVAGLRDCEYDRLLEPHGRPLFDDSLNYE